jgi:hypothetical protein
MDMVTSESLGDPTLDAVLKWHVSICAWCASVIECPQVIPFGMRNPMCPEYLEIIQEYADYEGQYAWNGNP